MRAVGGRLLALGAMLITPPFAFVFGIVGAVVLWNLLDGVGLPGWARLGLSLMAVPAVPGLWFLFLPIVFGVPRAMRGGGDEFQAWQDHQVKLWETHREAFDAISGQRIERVIASGATVTARDVTITLIAVAWGDAGGDVCLIQRARQPPNPADSIEMSDMLAELADDVGTTYVLMGAPVEMSGTVARSHLAFIPAVPAAATELRLSISKLFSLGNVETTPGPWEFIVPLPRRNS